MVKIYNLIIFCKTNLMRIRLSLFKILIKNLFFILILEAISYIINNAPYLQELFRVYKRILIIFWIIVYRI